MHPSRRRKKRSTFGLRTVEVARGPHGFGFTISGQQPCILSCIVARSPADLAGLRAGDFLIAVNGSPVSRATHDAVVALIGRQTGPITMAIADNYYSDSSDDAPPRRPKASGHKRRPQQTAMTTSATMMMNEGCSDSSEEEECGRGASGRPLHHHKRRVGHGGVMRESHFYQYQQQQHDLSGLNSVDEAGPVEYRALVGYLGTIEMPKQLLPSSRLQTVCSCIRKLRQEKRAPTAVLMTIFPTCLTLKNSSNHILAIYPTNRVIYIGSTADKEPHYFGIVTSAHGNAPEQQKNNLVVEPMDVSNSCHVFMVDAKIVEHCVHAKRADAFKITCTRDNNNGLCLEFPRTALYIVNLVQNLYKLQNGERANLEQEPVMANSPQPSASSNSDSGIGFRDDCGNVSDRILVVEFPTPRHPAVVAPAVIGGGNKRPSNIASLQLGEALDLPLNNNNLNNIRTKNTTQIDYNNLASPSAAAPSGNNINNIRATTGESSSIKNVLNDTHLLAKQNNNAAAAGSTSSNNEDPNNRLTVRAMLPDHRLDDDDSKIINIIDNENEAEEDFRSSVDNVSMHSATTLDDDAAIFKTPSLIIPRKVKRANNHHDNDTSNKQTTSADDCLMLRYKLSPKVYGLSKPSASCEELNNFDSCDSEEASSSSIDNNNYCVNNGVKENYGFGSLQELCSTWSRRGGGTMMRSAAAQSEPDVRIERRESGCEGSVSSSRSTSSAGRSQGPVTWAASFEKLLEDPAGLHTFAEFLKKEFSHENIYFWTACERFRHLPEGAARASEARRIRERHLCPGAPEPVNVDSRALHCPPQALEHPPATLFDSAQKQIFDLMKFDSYPRFLKSDLYKRCLATPSTLSGSLRPTADPGLALRPASPTPPSKLLKKSLSNAEDRRRKSLLPWHRKVRSKSKDRGGGDNVFVDHVDHHHQGNGTAGDQQAHNNSSSSKSSLTSLDLAICSSSSCDGHESKEEGGARCALCRVLLLSNGSTTVVQIQGAETIQQLVNRLLEKRGLVYSAFEVYTDKHPKPMDVNEPSIKLAGCEVTVEKRVTFKLDLPNKKIISVKSKCVKILSDVLGPILLKYGYNLDRTRVVTTEKDEQIDIYQAVTSVDGLRLRVQIVDATIVKNGCVYNGRGGNVKKSEGKLEELTNQVFEGILQEKSEQQGGFAKTKSDKGSVKSEDWGSEHSSGMFSRFLRRDSGLHHHHHQHHHHPTTKKMPGGSREEVNAMEQNVRKPLIAKWKAGVNKLQVTGGSESDELVEGLTRAQRSRLEDQRGTEINFELPDFLKNKEKSSKFYVSGAGVANVSSMTYENREILPPPPKDSAEANNNNLRPYYKTDSSCHSDKSVEPPPLPPKPKIVPIKPPNWGHNGFYRRDPASGGGAEKSTSFYLEQPSSSFV